MHMLDSPFIVPVIAIMVPIVALIANSYSRVQTERYRAEQRRDMLARNIPLPEIELALAARSSAVGQDGTRQPSSLVRTAGYIRLTATILMVSGLSLVLFFGSLALILHEPQVWAGAPVGILPFGVGIGFLIDYRARMREITRMREEGQL